jgi:hypothetical protein
MIIVESPDLCIVSTKLKFWCAEIKDLVELFEGHDQVFILKEKYTSFISKENVHKLFLN